MRKFCQSFDEFVSHLKWLAATGMLVISMGSHTLEIASTVKSAYDVALLAESQPAWFGSGPYWIESGPHDHWEDAPTPDLERNSYAVAFTIEVEHRLRNRKVGGHDRLLQSLAGFEYLNSSSDPSDPHVRSVLIKLPTEPADLRKLREILAQNSLAFGIDDGSGYMHEGNMFMGNGLRSYSADA